MNIIVVNVVVTDSSYEMSILPNYAMLTVQ